MTDQTDAELALEIRRDLNPRAALDEHYREHDAAREAALEAEGKPYGLNAEQVRAAKRHGMDLAEYAAWGKGATLADAERIAVDEAARKQAEHEALVERARKRLAGS